MKLLSKSNTKIMKGEAYGYLTLGLHLAPAWLSGYNVCPKASVGCAAACLNTAGMGKFSTVQKARIAKTKMFFEQREVFMFQLAKEIFNGKKAAVKAGLKLAIRLNLTSDIRWENTPVVGTNKTMRNMVHGLLGHIDAPVTVPSIIALFPDVIFYDYTKLANRGDIPTNYHLTFSKSESNDVDVDTTLATERNIAVVFSTKKGKPLPKQYRGRPVIDGDINDLRFLDAPNSIVGLRSKGDAKKDTSGFVVDASECGPLYQIEAFPTLVKK